MKFARSTAIAAVVSVMTAGAPLAQTLTDAEIDGIIAELERFAAGATSGRVAIAGIPSAYLTAPGQMKATLSGSYGPRRGTGPRSTRFDASTSLAIGFGDPVDAIGVEVGVVNLSFRRFGHSGYFTVGFNREFETGAGGKGAVALTFDRIGGWGDARAGKVGGTLVFSTTGTMDTASGPMPVMTTFGVGSNITRKREAGVILGVGMGLSPDWSVSGGIYGDSGVIGTTWHPVDHNGLSVGVTLRKQSTVKPVFGVDVGYAFNVFGG